MTFFEIYCNSTVFDKIHHIIIYVWSGRFGDNKMKNFAAQILRECHILQKEPGPVLGQALA